MKQKSLTWKIIGLIISIGLILGGLSGELVLRGTESSTALIVVGVLFLIWDLYALATHNRNEQEIKTFSKLCETFAAKIETDTTTLSAERKIEIKLYPENLFKSEFYKLYLNGERVGMIDSEDKKFTLRTQRVRNVLCAVSENEIKTYFFFEVESINAETNNEIRITEGGHIDCPYFEKMGIRILQPEQEKTLENKEASDDSDGEPSNDL